MIKFKIKDAELLKPKKNPKRILYLNANSLNNKLDLLKNIIQDLDQPDIIAVVETWKNDNIDYTIENYNEYAIYRTKSKGGGISIFTKIGTTTELIDKETVIEEELELLSINFDNIKVHTLYRPPSSKVDTFLNNIKHNLITNHTNEEIIILGDFNIDIDKKTNNAINLLNLMQSNSLINTVKEQTRITITTASKIDLVFSNIHNIITTVKGEHISDHRMIMIEIPNKIQYDNEMYNYRNINNQNLLNFQNQLQEIDWYNTLNNINVQNTYTKYDLFMNKLKEIYNYNFPIKIKNKTKRRINPRWWFTIKI